ncbi:alpha-tocopherol transfer protein-like isoform X1 [Stegodyphus dumicola]|uniref:alpha-tocopherol transfer protein-like isoform X1 n=1 Tax=Stegodyphus dumicola TaxID=202533 RepID=UPI0015B1773B|nr:alpha-tocopherol transfer protein-like isoform X1 [Stegodyphus dumicola]
MEIGTIDDIGAFSVVCSEIALKQESTQVSGAYIILDFKNCTLQHAYHMLSLRFVTKFVKYLQECWPCRLKGIYVINEPLYLHYVYRIMYPFFTKKLKQRCHIYGDNMKPLHKHIPRDMLPYELGGTAEPINVPEFQSFILGHEAYLQKINQYGFKDD